MLVIKGITTMPYLFLKKVFVFTKYCPQEVLQRKEVKNLYMNLPDLFDATTEEGY